MHHYFLLIFIFILISFSLYDSFSKDILYYYIFIFFFLFYFICFLSSISQLLFAGFQTISDKLLAAFSFHFIFCLSWPFGHLFSDALSMFSLYSFWFSCFLFSGQSLSGYQIFISYLFSGFVCIFPRRHVIGYSLAATFWYGRFVIFPFGIITLLNGFFLIFRHAFLSLRSISSRRKFSAVLPWHLILYLIIWLRQAL